jgi:DNA repair photolyase
MELQISDPGAGGHEFTPVVDQHASWLAVNPVQGCPKRCRYCFLNQRQQTKVAPVRLATAAQTVAILLASPLYGPERAVALFTWTDVMAVASSRTYLAGLLEALVAASVPNTIVLITKCRIPDGTIEAIKAARAAGLRVLVYLSYSGLDSAIEVGIRHEQLVANFPALTAAGIPVVHYWRPAFPASATNQTMTRVVDLAARYAVCSMAAGLKVEADALPRLAELWPELATTPGVTDAECVYPAAFWEFIHHTGERHPGYPVFHSNSCALAYAVQESDRFGIYGTATCLHRNRCPAAQRSRCARALAEATPVTEADVAAALARRGLDGTAFTHRAGDRVVTVHGAVPSAIVSAITQDLGIRVVPAGQGSDPYWSSGTAGARPLVIGASS